jgi:nucleotide-binding universal stress UspA family protein
MYNRLLVALDGSELSEGILPYARSFAKTLGIPVELLHVVDPDHFLYSVFAYHGRYYDIMTAEKKRSIDYLRKIATSFAGSASVDCSVETGNPAEVIVDRAASHAGILIAMTTHGRSGAKRWLLGGIAEKVLRAATNPLLLARSTEETKISDAVVLKTLLVPLDGSGVAETVLPHVAELAKKMNVESVLVRVYPTPGVDYPTGHYAADWERLNEEIRSEANRYLQQKTQQLQREGLERVSSLLLEGNAAEKIIDLARERAPSLIVMCSHGRTGVGRGVLGIVTDRIVRHSGDPMLIIRATTNSPRSAS